MQKPKGYFYDHELLEAKVRGFKELTPQARHALRDILDKIWSSSDLMIEDNKELMKYIGYTENKWEKVKVELTSLNSNFISRKEGFFTSKWLTSQAGKINGLLENHKEFGGSYDEIDDIEDLSSLSVGKKSEYNETVNSNTNNENAFKSNLLFKEKKGNIGVNTRASILNSKILKKYAGKGD